MKKYNHISVKDWGVISADIVLGGNAMADKDSLYMIAQAAYHFTQALEKSLKAIIRANTENIDSDTLHTHDFDRLLIQTELCCGGFIQKNRFLADNAQSLSAMNGARYGIRSVRKGDVYVLMKECQRLYDTLTDELCKETQKTRQQLQLEANMQYKDENPFFTLDDKHSKFNSNSFKPSARKKKETQSRE